MSSDNIVFKMLAGNKVSLNALILPSIMTFVLLIYYLRTNYVMSQRFSRTRTTPLNSCDETIEISASKIHDIRSCQFRRIINGEAEWSELRQFLMQTVNDNCAVLVTPDTKQLLRGQYQHHISKHNDKLQTVVKSSIEGDTPRH